MRHLLLVLAALSGGCTLFLTLDGPDAEVVQIGEPDAEPDAEVLLDGEPDRPPSGGSDPGDVGLRPAPPDAEPPAPDEGPCRPGREVCNGRDDDCDGEVDEEIPGVGLPCDVGEGRCRREGQTICGLMGDVVCDARAGAPTEETCDGTDEDCDGVPDDVGGDPAACVPRLTVESAPNGIGQREDGSWLLPIGPCGDGLCGERVTVRNPAARPVPLTLSMQRDPLFSLSGACPDPLPAGEACTFTAQYVAAGDLLVDVGPVLRVEAGEAPVLPVGQLLLCAYAPGQSCFE
jgi:hypothetical protein